MNELEKFAQVFCLVVIVATPLLLFYARRRDKDPQSGGAAWLAGADATSPPQDHSCDHGSSHGGSDCGGGSH